MPWLETTLGEMQCYEPRGGREEVLELYVL